MKYYPVFLRLTDKPCVVVGGDHLVEEKVIALLESGAAVKLVDPAPTGALLDLAGARRLTHVARRYRSGDLFGAFLVVSGRHERPVIDAIVAEATALNVPLNVIDETDDCSFISPSVVRRGALVVAISTSGKAPALAVRLRERFETELGEHHAEFLAVAGRLRGPLARKYPDFEERRALWYRLVDSEVLELLSRGERDEALATISGIVGFSPVGVR